jgi:hypothetical protein
MNSVASTRWLFVLGTKDGRWHAIRVEVRDRKLLVRARKGYQAS